MPENVSSADIIQVIITLFSLLSAICAIYFGFKNLKEKDKDSYRRDLAQFDSINSSLSQIKDHVGNIKEDLDDVRTDIKEMREEQKKHSRDLAIAMHDVDQAKIDIIQVKKACQELEVRVSLLEQGK